MALQMVEGMGVIIPVIITWELFVRLYQWITGVFLGGEL